MDLNRLEHILDRAAVKTNNSDWRSNARRICVGKVGRISPEAPVPVVEVIEESFYPGGAANVARNCASLWITSRPSDCSKRPQWAATRGTADETKNRRLQRGSRRVVSDNSENAIIARHQQVVRVDREQFTGPSAQQLQQVVAAVQKNIPDIDAIIFEDYGKGFLSTKMVSQITENARSAGKIVAADPNPRHLVDWRGVTVVKPNRAEALLAASIPGRDPDTVPPQDGDLRRAGEAFSRNGKQNMFLSRSANTG